MAMMPGPERQEVVRRVLAVLRESARPLILEHSKAGRRDTCIFSTRVGLEVARFFGLAAEPVVCRATVMNRIAAEYYDEHGDLTEAAWDLGAWVVGVGLPSEEMRPGAWPAHLAMVVDDRWLVDLSLDQADRPQYDLHLGSLVSEMPEDWKQRRSVGFGDEHGQRVDYEMRVDAPDYRAAPDWQNRTYRLVAGRLIRQIRAELERGNVRAERSRDG